MLTVACAWCGKELQRGDSGSALSHGMCVPCSGRNGFFPVEEVPPPAPGGVDHLPSGVIELDGRGAIRSFIWAGPDGDAEDWSWILGKSFFAEIAPWMSVRQFETQFLALAGHSVSGEAELAFLSRTLVDERLVFFEMVYDAEKGRAVVTIEQLA